MQQPRLALTTDQLTALLAAAPPGHRLALALGGDCGLRVSEIASLTASDVDVAGGVLHVLGKGGKRRMVPITPRVLALLTARRVLGAGKRIVPRDRRTLVRWVRSAAVGAGILFPPGNAVHALRHTYATRLVRAGVPIHVVQRLLGHANLATTAIYLHSSVDELHDALRILGAFEFRPPEVSHLGRDAMTPVVPTGFGDDPKRSWPRVGPKTHERMQEENRRKGIMPPEVSQIDRSGTSEEDLYIRSCTSRQPGRARRRGKVIRFRGRKRG